MRETNVTIQTIAQFLEERRWKYEVCGTDRIETGFRGDHASFGITIVLLEDRVVRLLVLVRISLVVPEDRRPQMAETIVRANYGLKVGGFKMDMSDGSLVFVAGMPIGGGTITSEQFDDLLTGAMGCVDHYFRAFARLLFGDDLSPAEVIAEVEMAK